MAAELPQPAAIGGTLTDLLGKSVGIKRLTAPLQPGPRVAVSIASYQTGDDEPVFLWVCELGLAASLGAALSMIPAGIAQEHVRKGRLDENLAENLHEVMNVGASMLSGGGTRVVLQTLHLPPDPAPAEWKTFLSRPPARLDLEVSIPGYEPGKMALLSR